MRGAFWLPLLLPGLAAQAGDGRPVLAVFSVEFSRMKADKGLDDVLSDYVATRLTECGQYQVVPRDQVKARLTRQKTASYKQCYDQSCQIEVGKELAAEKTLSIKVGKVGSKCTVGLNLYDLRKSTAELAATHLGRCDEDGLIDSLDRALGKLTGPAGSPPAPVQAQPPPAVAHAPPPQPPAPVPAPPEVEMVDIPAGFAWRGCNKGIDPDCPEDEQPGRLVELSAFAIDRTEVTVAQYQACVQAGRCSNPNPAAMQSSSSYGFFGAYGGGATLVGLNHQHPELKQHPMNGVSWRQAREYCAFAGKRLPTEAEWEKAARGPKGGLYPWGMDLPSCQLTVLADDEHGAGCGQGGTAEVCSRPEGNSPYGLCDLAGNVWEWVEDLYAEDYYAASAGKDPQGPRTGSLRCLKGGSYQFGPSDVRISRRSQYGEDSIAADIGFRCARTIP